VRLAFLLREQPLGLAPAAAERLFLQPADVAFERNDELK